MPVVSCSRAQVRELSTEIRGAPTSYVEKAWQTPSTCVFGGTRLAKWSSSSSPKAGCSLRRESGSWAQGGSDSATQRIDSNFRRTTRRCYWASCLPYRCCSLCSDPLVSNGRRKAVTTPSERPSTLNLSYPFRGFSPRRTAALAKGWGEVLVWKLDLKLIKK